MTEKFGKNDGNRFMQYYAVIAAALTFFITGAHMGWLAPSLPKILSDEYHFQVTADEASYIAIASPIGHVIGGFLYCYLNDLIGRRKSILLTAVPQLLSLSLVALSYYDKYYLYFARIAGGIGEGATLAIVPNYVAEITDPDIRGSLGIFIHIMGISGFQSMNLLGSYLNIYMTTFIFMIFPILLLILFSRAPESPYYYLMQASQRDAEACLKQLKGKANVQSELLQLSNDVKRQMSETGTYRDLFVIDSNRRAFFMAGTARMIQQLTGLSAFLSYFQILLAESSSMSPVWSLAMLVFLQMFITIVAQFYINRLGRRTIFVVSTGLTSLCLFVLAIYFTLNDLTGMDMSKISWVPLVFISLYMLSHQGGVTILSTVYTGELFSTSIKAKGTSLMSIVIASGALVTTKYYQLTADHIDLCVPFWTFAICSMIGTLYFMFGIVETKDKTLEQIQQELKGNVVDHCEKK